MKPDYSGAKTIEEARAIRKAYWDQIHKEDLEGKWVRITRAEFEKQLQQAREAMLKKKRDEEQRGEENASDNAA